MSRRSPKSDPQREQVYRWERKFYGTIFQHEIKPRALHKLVRDMAACYGIKKPTILKSRLGTKGMLMAQADGADSIELNESVLAYTGHLIAHEMAHVVCHAHGVEGPQHGPTFMGVYLWLLDKFNIVPACASLPSARKAGLKFKPLDKIKPGEL